MSEHTIPNGYIEDSQGRLVHVSKVRPVDALRDQLVRDLIARVKAYRDETAALKKRMADDIAAHVSLVAEKYGVELGGDRGNLVLTSFDGRLKIERARGDRVVVGEQIRAAEALIREILDEIQDPTARAIVDRSFMRDRRTGELSVARLVDLVSVEIDDERWMRAVQAIHDSLNVIGTTMYYRPYERAESADPWQYLSLDFSTIPVGSAP